MDIRKTITKNAQLLIAIGTLVGMVISVANFIVLTAIYPLKRDVQALESWKVEVQPEIKQIAVISTKLDTLKEDVKDIKSYWSIK